MDVTAVLVRQTSSDAAILKRPLTPPCCCNTPQQAAECKDIMDVDAVMMALIISRCKSKIEEQEA